VTQRSEGALRYVICAALALAGVGAFAGGYLLGRSDIGIDTPALAMAGSPAKPNLHSGGPPGIASPADALGVSIRKSPDLSSYVGRLVTRAPFETRKIAITVDDGPKEYTEAVLRILKENKAPATFFFVGRRIAGNESLVRAAIEQGCQVANHTNTHVELRGLSPERVEAELSATQSVIERITGARTVVVRPHGGMYDETALAVIGKLGMVLVNWDVHGEDTFESGYTSAQIEQLVVGTSRGGSIIMLHETNPASVQALPGIIEHLRARGYELVTVDDLLGHK
jgi:peptidoglycan/xylan/chitin deacetylase (PgdA/CDA1 family)